MNYKLRTSNRDQHYLDIEFNTKVTEETTTIQLPAWRPGRYELGDFAKNIQQFEVKDENGIALKFNKVTKDSWEVNTKNAKEIIVNYNYYSIDFNSGSTYLDEEVLYVNPVNCFVYIPSQINEKCVVEIPKGKGEQIACGLPLKSGKIKTNDFHELADTPFIVSANLQNETYESKGVKFYVWFYGECKPEWKKVITDFKKYTDYQLKIFGGFPVEEYHFINIILPIKAYHGVEHTTSTIITLGPSYDVMGSKYVDLLGVSSHELYHTWNIKSIRPSEMNPYDYTTENYSKLGYVAEGVTTYMGDLILFESGVFDKEQYAKEINQYLKRHFNNGGRLNKSVADSSYDTWLDGYEMGVPDRKSSIYMEGALVSFMIDMKTREATKGQQSLHSIMKLMYDRFGKKGIGYTEKDYKNLIEEVSGISFTSFFNSYIWGTKDFTKELKKCLKFTGFELQKSSSKLATERRGMIVTPVKEGVKIVHVQKDSSSYEAGLSRADLIIAVNGYPVKQDLDNWLHYFEVEKVELQVIRNGKQKLVTLTPPNSFQFWEQFVK
jgi:predicted metalloprotease with PDZ domain